MSAVDVDSVRRTDVAARKTDMLWLVAGSDLPVAAGLQYPFQPAFVVHMARDDSAAAPTPSAGYRPLRRSVSQSVSCLSVCLSAVNDETS